MSRANAAALWNALIRTHHITSRRKVSKLKDAAAKNEVYVLLKSGSPPGIMYVEGSKDGVEKWVSTVQGSEIDASVQYLLFSNTMQRLRYKDYQLAARPALVHRESQVDIGQLPRPTFTEIGSVKVFGQYMDSLGVLGWWREAMGYAN